MSEGVGAGLEGAGRAAGGWLPVLGAWAGDVVSSQGQGDSRMILEEKSAWSGDFRCGW